MRGLSASFLIHSRESKTISCYPVTNSQRGRFRRIALRSRGRPTILRMIDGLSDRQYEAMSCVLLEALGATNVNLTPFGSDGGVDGFGLISRPCSSHLFGSAHHPIRVVAQAKKYKTSMQADKMKEFLQTLNEVKHGGQPKTDAIIPSWFKGARGPIIGIVLSHRGFQSGADSRARSHGILTADSVDLAEVIALKGMIYGMKGVDKTQACLKRVSQLLAEGKK